MKQIFSDAFQQVYLRKFEFSSDIFVKKVLERNQNFLLSVMFVLSYFLVPNHSSDVSILNTDGLI